MLFKAGFLFSKSRFLHFYHPPPAIFVSFYIHTLCFSFQPYHLWSELLLYPFSTTSCLGIYTFKNPILFFIFFPFSLRYNWHATLCKCIDCKMTATALANISIMLHNYPFFFVMRTLRICPFSSWEVYDKISLTIIVMLRIRPQNLFISQSEFCTLWSSHFLLSPDPGKHHSTLWKTQF